MSNNQLALESIQRLPEDASLETIAERLEFLAGIRRGLDQIERGETVSHEEVKRQLATWLTKKSGRFKPATTFGKSYYSSLRTIQSLPSRLAVSL